MKTLAWVKEPISQLLALLYRCPDIPPQPINLLAPTWGSRGGGGEANNCIVTVSKKIFCYFAEMWFYKCMFFIYRVGNW